MTYTGDYQLTAGSDGIVHASADEAIEARDTNESTDGYHYHND